MSVCALYGFQSAADLEVARVAAEKALGVSFAAHDSSFRGEYYCFGEAGSEHFILQGSRDPVDGELFESKFPDYPILLYVEETPCPEARRESLVAAGFTLLRSTARDESHPA